MIKLSYRTSNSISFSRLLGTRRDLFLIGLAVGLLIYLVFYGYVWASRQQVLGNFEVIDQVNSESIDLPTTISEPARARLIFGGDVMLARKVGDAITARDFDPLAKLAEYLRSADLTVVNLECVIGTTGAQAAKPYTFHAPIKSINVLKNSGIDLVGLANNHVADFGQVGFLEMLGHLEQSNIGYFGAGRNESDAYSAKVVSLNGIKVAILGFNDREIPYFAAVGSRPGLAWMFENKVKSQVAAAKQEADYVIVMTHWGPEYTARHDSTQTRFGRMMIDSGADLVVGGHPHHIQPTEDYKGKKIIYSVGNFVFDGPGPNAGWYLGNLVDIELTKGQDGTVGSKIEFKPYQTDVSGSVSWL